MKRARANIRGIVMLVEATRVLWAAIRAIQLDRTTSVRCIHRDQDADKEAILSWVEVPRSMPSLAPQVH